MKRIAVILLLAALSVGCSMPAFAQRMTPEQYAKKSQKDAKKQQKMLKKANVKQSKAQKKFEKAQSKANKKANNDLRKRRTTQSVLK
jgi:PBP1b-binding outer membrane lipoprotein LpoB